MILRSRFILGSDRRLREAEELGIRDGRIVARGPAGSLSLAQGEERVDLGDAVLLPGWINAHAHLELTGLEGRLPAGAGFVPWVRALVRERRALPPGAFDEAIASGARRALRSGTTVLADVTTTGRSASVLDARALLVAVLEEAIDLDPRTAGATAEAMRRRVESVPAGDAGRLRGLAPHAPYTVSAPLFERLARIARDTGSLSSVHVCETPEEIEMIRSGRGALFDFLAELGEIPEGFEPHGDTPVAYLDQLGYLGVRPLLVHANYLTGDDVARIRRCGATVVFCPRSHRFFGHRDHPLPRLREAGIPIALGTDSLASNDSLSMLDEAREVARRFPAFAPEEILEIAYGGGARALGVETRCGSLEPGFRADAAAYRLGSPRSAQDALETLFARGGDPEVVVAAGELFRFDDEGGDRCSI